MLALCPLSALVLTLLPLVVVASPAPQGGGSGGNPGGPGVPSTAFMLYAYGDEFGGLPVSYYQGWAFLGNVSMTNDTESAVVIFQQGSDSTTMVGNPMPVPGATRPTWSNVTYYIPSNTSASHRTGFTNSPTEVDGIISRFVFYGSVAAHEEDDGTLETKWYALPYGSTGLWTLNWDADTDDTKDKVRVTLKSTRPSIPPPSPPTEPDPPSGPTPSPTMKV